MRFAKYLGAVAALSMATAPALAAPVNPATSLSVAKSVRASAQSKDASKLHGTGLVVAAVAAIAIVAGIIIIATDSKAKSP